MERLTGYLNRIEYAKSVQHVQSLETHPRHRQNVYIVPRPNLLNLARPLEPRTSVWCGHYASWLSCASNLDSSPGHPSSLHTRSHKPTLSAGCMCMRYVLETNDMFPTIGGSSYLVYCLLLGARLLACDWMHDSQLDISFTGIPAGKRPCPPSLEWPSACPCPLVSKTN